MKTATKQMKKPASKTRVKHEKALDAAVAMLVTRRLKATRKEALTLEATAKANEVPTLAPKTPRRLGALDAAALVLADAGTSMRTKDLIIAMAMRGLWTSPGGKTPEATLYAAILREISAKGTASRFAKVSRGEFSSTNKGGA